LKIENERVISLLINPANLNPDNRAVMDSKIVLVGGGSHCVACSDVIELENKYEIAGIVEKEDNSAAKLSGYPILGADEDLPGLARQYRNFLISIGFIKNPAVRMKLFQRIKELNGNFPVITSPLAYISHNASAGEGTIIMHRVIINAQARIGINCIINTACLIEHNSVIGDHCHISTGAIVNGSCRVGSRVFIGSGSNIRDFTVITDDVIIGSGSVVTKDITEKGIYAGNPARKINWP
jgi:sugar O-acyltransferase (sialic acid O-acetyltransferase NeuD family)